MLKCAMCNDTEEQDRTIHVVRWLGNVELCAHCRGIRKIEVDDHDDHRNRCRHCYRLIPSDIMNFSCRRSRDGEHHLFTFFTLDNEGLPIAPLP